MTYNEETFVLDSLQELREFIRSPAYKELCRETHENNVMLKKLLAIEYARLRNYNKENEEDFGRNVLANALSETIFKNFRYGK
jgi:hypothetical protein